MVLACRGFEAGYGITKQGDRISRQALDELVDAMAGEVVDEMERTKEYVREVRDNIKKGARIGPSKRFRL